MTIYALVDKASGIIENRIELEADVAYEPPPGKIIVADDLNVSHIGGRWTGLAFQPPKATPPRASVDAMSFVARLTDDELIGLLAVASRDADIARFVVSLLVREAFDPASAVAVLAKARLMALGTIAPERADLIFAG